MEFAIVFVLGAILGLITAKTVFKPKVVGNLHIETSDPVDGPYMFLELHKGVGDIYHEAYVVLKVDTKNYISRD